MSETRDKIMIKGKTLVFTGSLHYMTRSEAKQATEKAGGFVSGSVSTKTDLVVVGPGAFAKLKEAEKLGIRIISEDEFLELLKEGNN